MTVTSDTAAVVEAVAALGEPADFHTPVGYEGLALCVIDSIWSMGVRYGGVENVIRRYRATRPEADHDTPADLVSLVDSVGGPTGFAERMQNRQRTSTRNGVLKAEAVQLAAAGLVDSGVQSRSELSDLDSEGLRKVSDRWAAVPGQNSRISWKYFLMLAGVPGVKPDRMIRRFLAEALGRASAEQVGIQEAVDLVTGAADAIGVDATTLDYQIWLYQRTHTAA